MLHLSPSWKVASLEYQAMRASASRFSEALRRFASSARWRSRTFVGDDIVPAIFHCLSM